MYELNRYSERTLYMKWNIWRFQEPISGEYSAKLLSEVFLEFNWLILKFVKAIIKFENNFDQPFGLFLNNIDN